LNRFYSTFQPLILTPEIAGIFSLREVAEKVRSAIGGLAFVKEVELNFVAPGYIDFAKNVLGIDLGEIIKKETFGLSKMSRFDLDCKMTSKEFLEMSLDGSITPDDGIGYWSTNFEVSNVNCFSQKPDWATHVCWYNK
jgi:hypothetical protein